MTLDTNKYKLLVSVTVRRKNACLKMAAIHPHFVHGAGPADCDLRALLTPIIMTLIAAVEGTPLRGTSAAEGLFDDPPDIIVPPKAE
jgi:hypothetical protein